VRAFVCPFVCEFARKLGTLDGKGWGDGSDDDADVFVAGRM